MLFTMGSDLKPVKQIIPLLETNQESLGVDCGPLGYSLYLIDNIDGSSLSDIGDILLVNRDMNIVSLSADEHSSIGHYKVGLQVCLD